MPKIDGHDHVLEFEKAINRLSEIKKLLSCPANFLRLPSPPNIGGSVIVGWLFVDGWHSIDENDIPDLVVKILQTIRSCSVEKYNLVEINFAKEMKGGPADRYVTASVDCRFFEDAIVSFSSRRFETAKGKYYYIIHRDCSGHEDRGPA